LPAEFTSEQCLNLLDALTVTAGFWAIGDSWQEVTREKALDFIVAFLLEDLAYNAPLIPTEKAAELAEAVLLLFPNESRYLQNVETQGILAGSVSAHVSDATSIMRSQLSATVE